MNNEQFDILDFLTILAFGIAVINLDENRTQTNGIEEILIEVQNHLHKKEEIENN